MYEEVLHVDIVHYRGFWLPYKNYRGFWLPYRNYRGFWLPYRNYRGGQLPCKHYCALPWSLVTVQTLPWWPITVRSLLRITAVAGYRGKRYRNEKSLPREALIFLKKTSEEIAYFIFRSRFHVSLAVLCFATDCGAVDKPKGNRGRYEVLQTVRAGRMLGSTLNAAEGCFGRVVLGFFFQHVMLNPRRSGHSNGLLSSHASLRAAHPRREPPRSTR